LISIRMENIVTLNELARSSESIKRFGMKTEGLVELIRKNDGSYIVDPGFGISVDYDKGDSPELKSHFEQLTSKLRSPTIVLARSSDPREVPGKFETHSFLYSPDRMKESYNDLIEAIEKVRGSGARAVVGQVAAMEIGDIGVDYDYDEDLDIVYMEAFGADDTGFVYNTQNRFGKGSVICAAKGLPSKIVRGDRDICMIKAGEDGFSAVNLNHNYHSSSLAKFIQRRIDVISPSNPKEIVDQELVDGVGFMGRLDMSLVPFYSGRGPSAHREIGELFSVLGELQTDEREIEIEGSCVGISRLSPHLFQLRHYDAPKKRISELSKVSSDRILSGPFDSYVADRITGDLNFVSQDEVEKSGEGQLIFCNNYKSLMYGLGCAETSKFVNRLKERGVNGIVIPIKGKQGALYTGVHEMGLMTQELWLLQKIIPAIAMDGDHMGELERSIGGGIVPGVTIESDSSIGQIYKTL